MEDPGDTTCNIVISTEPSPHRKPIIFDPDFFVEKLRHEKPEVFLELVVSNLTRLIDLPGTEFSQLIGDEEPKLPTNTSFFRSFNFLKRKEKGVVFGAPLTEEGIAQVYQLIEYLYKNLHVEGLFRVPGNIVRQQTLKEALNTGADVDLDSGEFHPNDVATLLKMFLGELPEPLLSHRHFNAHLKIAGLMVFDATGKKPIPDKERRIEALQLLLLLLPSASRNLLKLLLDLLYHTAKQQHRNKMSASNLALMFAPHIIWPRNLVAADLQENITKLNNSVAFLIKHSQKLFRAPAYIRELARLQFTGSKIAVSKEPRSHKDQKRENLQELEIKAAHKMLEELSRLGSIYEGPWPKMSADPPWPAELPQHFDDLDLTPIPDCPNLLSVSGMKRSRLHSVAKHEETQQRTEEALRELFKHVSNMPDSAKKKKLVRQFNKNSVAGTPEGFASPRSKKHVRSRSFGGLIKRKVLGGHYASERKSRILLSDVATQSCEQPREQGKENLEQKPVELSSLHFSHLRSNSTDEILSERKQEVPRGIRMVITQESAM